MARIKPFSGGGFMKDLKAKKGFLLSVYTTLIVQLIVTFATMSYLTKNEKLGDRLASFWLPFFILQMIIIFVIILPIPIPIKLALFTVFAIIFGVILYPLTKRFTKEMIRSALMGAIGVFVGMSLLAVTITAAGVDLSFAYMYLFAVLIGLVVTGIVLMFITVPNGSSFHKFYLSAILVLFALFTVVDTNMILQKDYTRDFIGAAMDFYLNLLNMFTSILQLDSM